MKVPLSERTPRRPRAKELVEASPENQPPRIEDMVPPEVWAKIKEYLPTTLQFSVKSFEQAFEPSMFFCLAFPEQCKDINLGEQVEKDLQEQLRVFKDEGHPSLWMNLLICARSLFPEKRLEYSIQRLWPELLNGKHSWKDQAQLLILVPELRHTLVTDEWIKEGREILADPEFFSDTFQNILLLFSPKYREEKRSTPWGKKWEDRIKKEIKKIEAIEETPNPELWRIEALMREMARAKMVFGQDIEFVGDSIVINDRPKTVSPGASLPERLAM